MSVDTFNPQLTPSVGTSEKVTYKVLKADFGDGYMQAAPDGINSVRRAITLKWEYLTIAQAQAMRTFFDAKAGATPFFYTVPGEITPVLWTADDVSEGYPVAGYRSLQATLTQSFNVI